ncbi:MAG: hypothetical protein Kow0029_28820 [Candidatus Rifleibacteriota bacterium]
MINEDLFTTSLSFDQFNYLFLEQLNEIPDRFKEGISQFVVEERELRLNRYMMGIYTLGQYFPKGYIGQPVVVLYYGSFRRVFPHLQVNALRKEIAKTIAHELLHHWELRSGYDSLGEEDKERLAEWKLKTGYTKGGTTVGKNLLEAVLYIYLVFVLIGVLARWIGVVL